MGTGEIIVAALAGFGGAFTFLVWTDFALVRAEWCSDGTADCFREWVGALGGWVAAAAAAVTIVVLMGQKREMQRQADSLLGNEMPAAEIYSALDDIATVRLVVTNWNRRPILIEGIRPLPGSHFTGIEYRGNRIASALEPDGRGRFPPIHVAGWIDRQQAPPRAEIIFMATSDDAENAAEPDYDFKPRPIAADVRLRIIGAKHETHVTRVEVPDHLTL